MRNRSTCIGEGAHSHEERIKQHAGNQPFPPGRGMDTVRFKALQLSELLNRRPVKFLVSETNEQTNFKALFFF